jgi:hypothetical protein
MPSPVSGQENRGRSTGNYRVVGHRQFPAIRVASRTDFGVSDIQDAGVDLLQRSEHQYQSLMDDCALSEHPSCVCMALTTNDGDHNEQHTNEQ